MTCGIVYPLDGGAWAWAVDSACTAESHRAPPVNKAVRVGAWLGLFAGGLAEAQRLVRSAEDCAELSALAELVAENASSTEWLVLDGAGGAWSLDGHGALVQTDAPAAIGTGADRALGFLAGVDASLGPRNVNNVRLALQGALECASAALVDVGPPFRFGLVTVGGG